MCWTEHLFGFTISLARTDEQFHLYQTLRQDDDATTLPQAALDHLPKGGRIQLMVDITLCESRQGPFCGRSLEAE
jgi:hypothetical protein